MTQGTLSIVLDTPEGKLTLTKEEARKLYETLHELFGPKSYPSYPSAPPSYPIPREHIPSVPGDWPKPAPIWCGGFPLDKPTPPPARLYKEGSEWGGLK
jgi:hypothetical protein